MFTLKLELPPGYDRISNLAPLIQVNVLRALEDGMLIAKNKAQTSYMTGPRPERLGVVSGRLRSSLYSGAKKGMGGVFATGFLGSQRVVYARIHEEGEVTPPHIIKAKDAPYLVFFWERIGKWMRIKKVNHPGSRMPARPYLDYGLRMSLPKIFNLMQLAVNEAYKKG